MKSKKIDFWAVRSDGNSYHFDGTKWVILEQSRVEIRKNKNPVKNPIKKS